MKVHIKLCFVYRKLNATLAKYANIIGMIGNDWEIFFLKDALAHNLNTKTTCLTETRDSSVMDCKMGFLFGHSFLENLRTECDFKVIGFSIFSSG